MPIDLTFRALRLHPGLEYLAIPPECVDPSPRSEVENRNVPVDVKGQHGCAEEIRDGVVSRITAHWTAVLAGHHR